MTEGGGREGEKGRGRRTEGGRRMMEGDFLGLLGALGVLGIYVQPRPYQFAPACSFLDFFV